MGTETTESSMDLKSDQYSIIADNIWKTFKIPIKKANKLHTKVMNYLLRRGSGYKNLEIFKGINFKIKKGETIGIIGDNGAGKSTLLKIIAGIIFPDRGKIEVKGKVAPFIELGAGFDLNYTAENNVFLYGTLLGLSRKKINNRIDEIFKFAELESFRKMKYKNLSSGMKIRLAFAIAIQMDPDIILIDEIITVGDQRFKTKSSNKIKEFIQRNKTVIYVSHNLNMIRKLCDNAIWLYNGKINSYGKSKDVINDYKEYIIDKRKADKNSKINK